MFDGSEAGRGRDWFLLHRHFMDAALQASIVCLQSSSFLRACAGFINSRFHLQGVAIHFIPHYLFWYRSPCRSI